MAGIDAVFETNVLVHVVRNLKLPSQFLLDTFFPNTVEFDTEYVSIDVDVGLRRMAPFVSPLVEGKPVAGRKFQTNTFRPAYIKDLRTPDFRKPVLRAIGERIAGTLSPRERIMQNLALELEDQVQMVQRRLEWMAAQSLMAGGYTVSGDGFEPVLLSFGRDPALTVDLSATGANTPWSATNPASQYIETWAQLVLQKSGAAPTDIVFSTSAYNLFLLDPRVQQSVWYLRSGESRVEFGGTPPVHGAVFKGEWGGYRLWVYNDWYVDQLLNMSWAAGATSITIPSGSTLTVGSTLTPTPLAGAYEASVSPGAPGVPPGCTVTAINGTTATLSTALTASASGATLSFESPMLPANSVILSSRNLDGVRAFGAIMDEDFAYGALAFAPKSWVEKNPSRRHLLMQSAPVVIPARVNAALAAKVA